MSDWFGLVPLRPSGDARDNEKANWYLILAKMQIFVVFAQLGVVQGMCKR